MLYLITKGTQEVYLNIKYFPKLFSFFIFIRNEKEQINAINQDEFHHMSNSSICPDNNYVASNVSMSVSVTIVISEWEGGAHEGSHVESNHVLLHSTELFGSIRMVNYRMQ